MVAMCMVAMCMVVILNWPRTNHDLLRTIHTAAILHAAL